MACTDMYVYRMNFGREMTKRKNMKNFNSNSASDIFGKFVLSNEEMICVRGGEDDTTKNTPPPVNL
jgi:hypothetical protein